MTFKVSFFRLVWVLISACLGFSSEAFCQPVLTFKTFMEEVIEYHPITAMSEQILVQAQQTLTKAKGEFDPLINTSLEQKQFEQKQYYSYWHNSMELPTRWGTRFLAGFDQNNGDFINPQESIPVDGLWYLGLEQPLLKGMLYDERRAQLDLAQNALRVGEQDRRAIRNSLYLQAAQAYFQWVLHHRIQVARRQAFDLATQRWHFIKERHRLGDLPAIDTLEALATRQNRRLEWSEALLEEQKSYVLLQAFLWSQQGEPRTLEAMTRPDTSTLPVLPVPSGMTGIITDQPELNKQKLKIEALQIEKRLSIESLKPDLTLAYLPLRSWTSPASTWFNDYKWKVGVKFPLFFRKGWGEKRSLESKINLETWQLADKQNTWKAKIESARLEIINLNDQLHVAQENIYLYAELLAGERIKLSAGESSVFLINTRESAYLSAQEKYFLLQYKLHQAWVKLQYLTGNPVW